jgi:leucyl aminopeptidase (aminopeptidase T)
MLKSVYDTDDNGIVDKATADKDGNELSTTYAKSATVTSDIATAITAAEAKIPTKLSGLSNDMSYRSVTWSTVSIPVSAWSSNAATVAAAGMTADETATSCILGYYPADKALFEAAGIYCSAQGADTITLTCRTTPTAAIRVNIAVLK